MTGAWVSDAPDRCGRCGRRLYDDVCKSWRACMNCMDVVKEEHEKKQAFCRAVASQEYRRLQETLNG